MKTLMETGTDLLMRKKATKLLPKNHNLKQMLGAATWVIT